MLFCETHLKDNKGLQIDGYSFCGKARNNGAGGGVGICVKNDHKCFIAPHQSARDLEIIWVSVARGSENPLFIGVYYGLQESVSYEKITNELDLLREELIDIRRDGEILLCMDANAKCGLMGEQISRNGRMMMELFDDTNMHIMNKSEKCVGLITRQNRSKPQENSVIDYVTTSYNVCNWIQKIEIDEIGDYRFKSKNKETDHNTMVINIQLPGFKRVQQTKIVKWNLRAPPEKWMLFREKLTKLKEKSEEIISDKETDLSERYKKWEKLLYSALMQTIGKTTIKTNFKPKPSTEIKKLREERKRLKKIYEQETDPTQRPLRLQEYRMKQKEIKEQSEKEEAERLQLRFQKMTREGRNGLWNEIKRMKSNRMSEWSVMKDENGKRSFDPDNNKRINAEYYEKLYGNRPTPHHDYHDYVKQKMTILEDETFEDRDIDQVPTKKEIEEIIKSKKNKKATTDWDNEILKRGGEPMVDFLMPVVTAFWNEGIPIRQWNQGIITNVFKGKGDPEKMENQRGITVSSSIGTIVEEVLTRRLMQKVNFSQAQAGGKKGGRTIDHIFILKSLISMALKKG